MPRFFWGEGVHQAAAQFVPGIADDSERIAQSEETKTDYREHIDGSISILTIGSMGEDQHQEAERVSDDKPISAFLTMRPFTGASSKGG
jgi:hypothetical protein